MIPLVVFAAIALVAVCLHHSRPRRQPTDKPTWHTRTPH